MLVFLELFKTSSKDVPFILGSLGVQKQSAGQICPNSSLAIPVLTFILFIQLDFTILQAKIQFQLALDAFWTTLLYYRFLYLKSSNYCLKNSLAINHILCGIISSSINLSYYLNILFLALLPE